VSAVHSEALVSYLEKGLEVKSVLPTTARSYAEPKAIPTYWLHLEVNENRAPHHESGEASADE
jgi:hypothetical protein